MQHDTNKCRENMIEHIRKNAHKFKQSEYNRIISNLKKLQRIDKLNKIKNKL